MITLQFVKIVDGIEITAGESIQLGIYVGQAGANAVLPEGVVVDTEYASVKAKAESALQSELDPVWNSEKSSYQTKSDETLQTLEKSIVPAINELKNRVDGLPEALTFENIQDLVNNFNAYLGTEFVKGQSALIIELDVPDTWITAINLTNVHYVYVDDATFIADLLNGVQIGFYTLRPLETEKVNLENYYTKSEIDQLLGGKSNVGHTHFEEIIKPDVVEYQLTPTTPTTQGAQYWDSTYKVLSTVLGDGVVLQNGLEMYVRVVNKTGIEITDGQAVYINGAQGNRPTANLAIATSATAANVIGVATQPIANNAEGFVTVFGNVYNFNTSGYADGGSMYLSAATAGGLTPTEPTYPNHKVVVATALNSTTNGTIFVKPTHIYELGELHGVDLTETTPTDADSILMRTSGGIVKQSLFSTLKTFLLNYFAPKLNPIFSGVMHNSTPTYTSYASLTADTVGDTRFQVVAGVRRFERCTGANATKGGGTWVVDMSLDASGYLNSTVIKLAAGGVILGANNSLTVSQYVALLNDNTAVVVGNASAGSLSALAFYSKNTEAGRFLPDQSFNLLINKYQYRAASATADTINDTRTSNVAGVKIEEICTGAGATKGGGTWKKTTAKSTIGGYMVSLTNKTGATSVKGTVVYASTTTDNAFNVNPIDGDMPFGIVYENGIADGAECWVVVSGIAEVLLVNSVAATRSYIAYASGTTAGRIDTAASAPAASLHFREIGHTLESKTAGTNVLVKCVLHFN